MAFGPVIGGGGSGGGGGLEIVTLSALVPDVINDGMGENSVDVDLALPSGVSRCAIIGCSITRTDGDSLALGLWAYPANDRSGNPMYLLGDEFNGVDITGDDVPVYGPRTDSFAGAVRNVLSYVNLAGAEFMRATVVNTNNATIADVAITVEILPIG